MVKIAQEPHPYLPGPNGFAVTPGALVTQRRFE